MPYVINKWDGTPLVSIADRTVDTQASTIRLPGRNYPSYGELVVEDMVWMLENFAGAAAPPNPLVGQLWYDTGNTDLKVWDGNAWASTTRVQTTNTDPAEATEGQLRYDPATKQLFAKDNALGWKLIGPIGAENNANINVSTEGNTAVPTYSLIDAVDINDNRLPAVAHPVLRLVTFGTVVAIISKDPSFVPRPAIPGFNSIEPGLNLNQTIAGINITGLPTQSVNNKSNLPATTEFVHRLLPYGAIIMWYGTLAGIPTGWTLCDGNNGTPDLRDKFVIGAGIKSPGNTGGSNTLNLSGTVNGDTDGIALTVAQMPAHSHDGVANYTGDHYHQQGSESLYHDYGGGSFPGYRGWGLTQDLETWRNQYTSTAGGHTHTVSTVSQGEGQTHRHPFNVTVNLTATVQPPYYALAYIMKTSGL